MTTFFNAQLRHAVHYCDELRGLAQRYREGGDAFSTALASFDRESANLQAAQSWIETHAHKDDRVARLCSEYWLAGYLLFELRLPPALRVERLGKALEAARRLQDRRAMGRQLCLLAVAKAALGLKDESRQSIREALVIAREIGDLPGEVEALGLLGEDYYVQDSYSQAIRCYKGSLKLARELGDLSSAGAALDNLGLAYASLKDPKRAVRYYRQAQVTFDQIGDLRGQCATLGNQGWAHLRAGKLTRAFRCFERQLQLARDIGDHRRESIALGGLGDYYRNKGELRQAVECYEQALPILRELGARVHIGDTLYILSQTLYALGDRERALAEAEQALAVFEKLQDHKAAEVHHQLEQWRSADSD